MCALNPNRRTSRPRSRSAGGARGRGCPGAPTRPARPVRGSGRSARRARRPARRRRRAACRRPGCRCRPTTPSGSRPRGRGRSAARPARPPAGRRPSLDEVARPAGRGVRAERPAGAPARRPVRPRRLAARGRRPRRGPVVGADPVTVVVPRRPGAHVRVLPRTVPARPGPRVTPPAAPRGLRDAVTARGQPAVTSTTTLMPSRRTAVSNAVVTSSSGNRWEVSQDRSTASRTAREIARV